MRVAVAVVLIALGGLAAGFGLATAYARAQLLDADPFAGRAERVLDDAPARAVIAREVAVRVEARVGALGATSRSIIEPAVAAVIDAPAFRAVFGRSVARAHDQVLDGNQSPTLLLGDVTELVAAEVAAVNPALGRAVRTQGQTSALAVPLGRLDSRLDRARDTARAVRTAGLLAPILAALLLLGGIAISPSRRVALAAAGVVVALAGLATTIAVRIARTPVGDRFASDVRPAVDATYDELLGSLATWGLIAAAAGAIVAIAAVAARALGRSAAGRPA